MVRRFQRQAHHYIDNVPAIEDRMQWLALMQHHGAPTRLMDWTYSFFVAVFFALEECEPDKACAVWMLSGGQCRSRSEELLRMDAALQTALEQDPHAKSPGTVQALVFREHPECLAYPLNPFRLNQRLVIQQGVFMVPGSLAHSFESNLGCIVKQEDLLKIELELSLKELSVALTELLRMNMSRATLFPGLDGFSGSLKCLTASPFVIQSPNQRDTERRLLS